MTFYVRQALSCSNGGLIITRHDETIDKIIHLSRQAFSHKCIFGEPLIHQGRSRLEGGG